MDGRLYVLLKIRELVSCATSDADAIFFYCRVYRSLDPNGY